MISQIDVPRQKTGHGLSFNIRTHNANISNWILPIRKGPRLMPGEMDSSIRFACPTSSCFGDSCIDGERLRSSKNVTSGVRSDLKAT